jgi:hypothetical protein
MLAMNCALAGAERQVGRPLNEIVRLHFYLRMDYSIIKQPLQLGVAAFLVAGVGAPLGFAAHSIEVRWLAIFAFCLVAMAVACGFIAIGWGWYRLAARKDGDRNAI